MFPMLNFERVGTGTTGPVFGVGFCACSMFALPITMLNSAITRRVCFILVFSWEGAHSPPSLIQTPPSALSFRQTHFLSISMVRLVTLAIVPGSRATRKLGPGTTFNDAGQKSY